MRENIWTLGGNILVAILLLPVLAGAGGCLQPDVQYRGMAAFAMVPSKSVTKAIMCKAASWKGDGYLVAHRLTSEKRYPI